jgi:hypothetical protein
VGSRQDAVADHDRAHGAGIAAVDARLAVEDLAAHDLGFQLEYGIADEVGIRRVLDALGQGGDGLLGDFAGLDRASLLAGNAIGFAQFGFRQFGDAGDERLVPGRGLPVPFRLAGDFDQLVDGLDRGLHLVMAEHHGAEHDLFGELLGLGFDHQHGGFGSGDHQVQLCALQLGLGRAQHILAVDVADAGGADRAAEGNAGNGHGGRGADHGGNIRIDFRVAGHHGTNDLHFVIEGIREQGTQRTVDQAAGENFLFRRTSLALEEAARDAAGGVGSLLVIDGQRKEILARLGVQRADHRGQNDGVIHGDHDGTTRLAGDLGGFDGDRVVTVGKALLDRIQHKNSFRQNIKAGTAIMAVPACSASLRSIWRKAHRAIGMTRTGAW